MKQKVFLVYVLIEYSAESTTDTHYVYSSIEKAHEVMTREIAEARESFDIESGGFISHTDRCQEWCNDDGQSYSIGIEEIDVL